MPTNLKAEKPTIVKQSKFQINVTDKRSGTSLCAASAGLVSLSAYGTQKWNSALNSQK